MTTILDRVSAILTKKFSVPAENIRAGSTIESLGLDSLDLIELLFEVEDEFQIRVPQEGSALKTATVQDIIDNIGRLAASAPVEQADGE